MAINGENHHFDRDFIRHIKKYCTKIYSLYDKDEAGKRGAEYLENEYSIPQLILPDFKCEKKKIKDITDAWLYCNKQEVQEFIKMIKNLEIS